MRHITAMNKTRWVARFTELNLQVEWGGSPVHPSLTVSGVAFTFQSLNHHPSAAEALWNGDVSLALHLVS